MKINIYMYLSLLFAFLQCATTVKVYDASINRKDCSSLGKSLFIFSINKDSVSDKKEFTVSIYNNDDFIIKTYASRKQNYFLLPQNLESPQFMISSRKSKFFGISKIYTSYSMEKRSQRIPIDKKEYREIPGKVNLYLVELSNEEIGKIEDNFLGSFYFLTGEKFYFAKSNFVNDEELKNEYLNEFLHPVRIVKKGGYFYGNLTKNQNNLKDFGTFYLLTNQKIITEVELIKDEDGILFLKDKCDANFNMNNEILFLLEK